MGVAPERGTHRHRRDAADERRVGVGRPARCQNRRDAQEAENLGSPENELGSIMAREGRGRRVLQYLHAEADALARRRDLRGVLAGADQTLQLRAVIRAQVGRHRDLGGHGIGRRATADLAHVEQGIGGLDGVRHGRDRARDGASAMPAGDADAGLAPRTRARPSTAAIT